ncbi:MAG: hypothetical protein KJ558_14925 [Gammaproteobacteria bacterium]|nr:hypothetical protein [Gammaproteobacteria bacterium]MBU1656081.1 hypothetical protein [Gammaproteobacteria bacterium]MBU1962166.1 hypothetical protein [Gammaproteobacteria bacterium]
MPYFIYRVIGPRNLEYIDTFDDYKEAKDSARLHRVKLERDTDVIVRMIFANNQAEAERLLLAPREERYIDEG